MNDYWRICKETNKQFDSLRGFLNHLRSLKMTSKEYYDKHFKNEIDGICYCGNLTKYHGFSYKKYCSCACSSKSKEHRKLVSERFIKNPEALENVRKLRKENQIDYNIEKRKNTIKNKCEKLGITEKEYYSNHSKKGAKTISFDKKRKAVLMAIETKQKNQNFGGRSGYKAYDFFGQTVSLQGYEPIVLKCLIDDYGFGINDIMIGKNKVPIIKYNINGKKLYFPDFYLPKFNLIIEVKSEFTLSQHYDNVMMKCNSTIEAGYSILLLVVTKHEARNGKLDGSKKLLDWAISSQAPNPTWYGEGSTTILYGVESSDSKCNPTING